MAEASDARSRSRRSSECAGRNENERCASPEKVDAQTAPTTLSGKADTAGETGESMRAHKESAGNTRNPLA
ncbi:MAG TPA: hypothetical protein VLU73_02735, partial [Methylococcaceae bacterium]|nr:hypothetical protein [Methylococcaceae bacterium]